LVKVQVRVRQRAVRVKVEVVASAEAVGEDAHAKADEHQRDGKFEQPLEPRGDGDAQGDLPPIFSPVIM